MPSAFSRAHARPAKGRDCARPGALSPRLPATDKESFARWLKRTRQTERAIRHFWEPVVAGALNDVLERCSTKYAAKVFHESFLRSPDGGRLGIPTAPLSEFFQPVVELARKVSASICAAAPRRSDRSHRDGRWKMKTRECEIEADAIVLATSFRQTQRTDSAPLRLPPTEPASGRANRASTICRRAHHHHPSLVRPRGHRPRPRRRCSIRASSGCSPSRAFAVGTPRGAAIWSSSSARPGPSSACRASRSSPPLCAKLDSFFPRVREATLSSRRAERGPRHILGHARTRRIPPAADHRLPRPLRRRRLDRYGMALDHGGRGPQRTPGRRRGRSATAPDSSPRAHRPPTGAHALAEPNP